MVQRITVILHPNENCVDFVLNDRMFNQERYSFSRKIEAKGSELAMLNVLNTCTVGIDDATASKNTLSIKISDGVLCNEFVPAVIIAIKHFVNEKGYNPEIYCDNRRWKKEPVRINEYDERGGEKYAPTEFEIGVQYKPWVN